MIACFESGHPLYTLTPRLGEVHCVSAPGPVIGWVLMVAGTALVHLLLLPPLLAISAWLARVLLHAARTVRSTLRPAITPLPLPMPAFVPLGDVRYPGLAISDPPPRANPRRGPPCVN